MRAGRTTIDLLDDRHTTSRVEVRGSYMGYCATSDSTEGVSQELLSQRTKPQIGDVSSVENWYLALEESFQDTHTRSNAA